MAKCERCEKGGYRPDEMLTDGTSFIGPCCAEPGMQRVTCFDNRSAQIHVLPGRKDDVEYGFEVSNKIGVRAYANYHGLAVSFERSPDQIKQWAEQNGLVTRNVG